MRNDNCTFLCAIMCSCKIVSIMLIACNCIVLYCNFFKSGLSTEKTLRITKEKCYLWYAVYVIYSGKVIC